MQIEYYPRVRVKRVPKKAAFRVENCEFLKVFMR